MDFWSLTKQLKQEWLVIHLQFLSIHNGSTLFTLTCFLFEPVFCLCVCVVFFYSVSSKPGICASENVLEKTRGECLAGISKS